MKKKIAILTQPLGINYGGILQNYALQTVLKKLGFFPVTINRWNNYSIPWFRKQLYYFKLQKVFYKDNFKFIKKHINLTEKLDSDKKFYKHIKNNHYDGFVVGSDQTWRPDYSPNIYNYFLDFLKDTTSNGIKKIAYASSFGKEEWTYDEKTTHEVKELVKQFNAVSVREDSGVDLCKKYLDIEAIHVLDPTMLLNKKDYQKLYEKKGYPKRQGVFTYILDYTSEKQSIVDDVSKKLHLQVFRNQPALKIKGKKEKLKNRIYPPLETWLKSFDDADFVITDSFHGTVFSIIFSKPFLVIPNKVRGVSRFTSLLLPLGLENRIINDVGEISSELLQKPIDYNIVHKRLEEWKKESLNFLNNALK